MAKLSSWLPVDLDAKLAEESLTSVLRDKGYILAKSRKKGFLSMEKDAVHGTTILDGRQKLRVRIVEGSLGQCRLEFTIVFPQRAIISDDDRRVIDRYLEDLLDRIQGRIEIRLYEGTVSENGSAIDFDGKTPPFYSSWMSNIPYPVTRRHRILGLVLGIAFSALYSLFVVPYIFGEITLYLLLVGTIIFLPLALFCISAYVYLTYSPRYPREVMPTLLGLRIITYRGRHLSIPWSNLENVVSHASMWTSSSIGFSPYGSTQAEFKAYYADKENRRRLLFFEEDVAQAVQKSLDLARKMPLEKKRLFEVWNTAPPRSQVFLGLRPLPEEVMKSRKLSLRFLPSGRTDPVYVTTEEDRRIARDYLSGESFDAEELRGLGSVASTQEYWDLGAEIFKKALELEPSDAEIMYHYGGCLTKNGKLEEAKDSLEEFIASYGPHSEIHVALAGVALQSLKPEESIYHVGKAVELDPNNLEALHIWFDAVSREGGISQAIAELDFLSSSREDSWAVFLVLGEHLENMGMMEDAQSYLERAVARSSREETVSYLSAFYLRKGDPQTAIDTTEKAAKEAKLGPASWYNLAIAYKMLGRRYRAREALDNIDLSAEPGWHEMVMRLISDLEKD